MPPQGINAFLGLFESKSSVIVEKLIVKTPVVLLKMMVVLDQAKRYEQT